MNIRDGEAFSCMVGLSAMSAYDRSNGPWERRSGAAFGWPMTTSLDPVSALVNPSQGLGTQAKRSEFRSPLPKIEPSADPTPALIPSHNVTTSDGPPLTPSRPRPWVLASSRAKNYRYMHSTTQPELLASQHLFSCIWQVPTPPRTPRWHPHGRLVIILL